MSDCAAISDITARMRGCDRHQIAMIETFEGVPVAILELWLDTLAKIQRLRNAKLDDEQRERVTNTLQSRLETVALLWHGFSGDDDKSDQRLHAAAEAFEPQWKEAGT